MPTQSYFLMCSNITVRKDITSCTPFAVMPDHVHFLITSQDVTIERAVQLIKGGFSRRIGSKFPVWQKGYTERRIRDADEFITRKEYIRLNPVRGHLAQHPVDYPFSSAFRTRTAAAEAAEL
jgi:putative transposase